MMTRLRELLLALLAWSIPVLLTVLPVLVLRWAGQEERQRHRTDALRHLEERLQSYEHRMKQASTITFWVESALRQMQQGISRNLRRNPGRVFERDRLAADLEKAARRARGWLPEAKFWAVELPVATGSDYRLMRIPGFESGLSGMITGLFREILDNAGRRSQADAAARDVVFARRLSALFGEGVDPDLFRMDAQGAPFSVVFQGESCRMAWDLIVYRNRPAVGLLILTPERSQASLRALQLSLERWRSPAILPGYLPIPLEDGAPPVLPLLHRRLIGERTDRELAPFLSLLRIVRPPAGAGTRVGENVFTRFLTPWIGRLIPLDARQERFLWFLPLAPLSGHLGFLVANLPPVEPGRLEALSHLFGLIVVMGWVLALIHHWLFGRLPLPGVRGQLTWWLGGVALLPVLLAVGAGERFHADLASNRKDALAAELRQVMRRLESGAKTQESRLTAFGRRVAASPRLSRILARAETDPRIAGRTIELLLERFSRRGLPLGGVRIHGPRSVLGEDWRGIPRPVVRRYLGLFLEQSWGEALSYWECDPGPFRKSKSFALQSFRNVFGKRDSDHQPHFFRAGGRQYMSFRQGIFVAGRPRYQLALLWKQESLTKPYLMGRLRDADLVEGSPGLCLTVFQRSGSRLEEIGSTGGEGAERVDVRNVARLAIDRPIRRDGDRELFIAWPSRELPGFVIVGRVSLQALEAELAAESRWFAGMVLLLLLLIGTTARLLTDRLANPVVRMTDGLLQVAKGELGIRVAEPRRDELGSTGTILDRMTGWLGERRRMSRFVSPQVLDVVAGGDPAAAMAGSIREVAILVSDIRSFTTHSESQPAAAIFSMLNRHMERMTKVIQQEGGAIDRFIGDAIQAVFYADPTREHPSRRAVRAALAMRFAHEDLRRERRQQEEFEYEIGIGIEEGKVVAGVIGDPGSRLDFSVLGEPLREAGELEASSKDGRHTRVVVSPAVVSHAGDDFLFEGLSGRTGPLELVGNAAREASPVPGPIPVSSADPREATGPLGYETPTVDARFDPGRVLKPSWLALWLVPALLSILTAGWWQGELVQNRREQHLGELRERLRTSRALAEPIDQLSRTLQDWWSYRPGDDPRTIARNLVARWGRFGRLFPEASWYCWEARPGLTPLPKEWVDRKSPITVSDLRLVGLRRSPRFADFEPDMRMLSWLIVNYGRMSVYQYPKPLYLDLPKPQYDWMANRLISFLDVPHHRFFDFLGSGRRNLGSLEIRKKPWFAAWDAWHDREGRLCGGILLLLPQDALTSELSFRCLVDSLKQDGFEASLTFSQASVTRRIESAAFRRDPRLREAAAALKNGDGGADWLIQSDRWSGDGAVHLTIAHLAPGARMEQAWRKYRPPTLLAAVGAAWFFAGAAFLLVPTIGRALVMATLRRQMVGGFLMILVPALLLSFLSIERSLNQRRGRVIAEQEQRLRDTLSSADRGILVQRGFLLSQMAFRLSRQEMLGRLASDTAAAKARQPLSPDGFQFIPAILDWAGIPIRTANLIDPGEVALGHNFDPRWVDVQRLFRARTLSQLSGNSDSPPRSKASGKDLALGSEVEDYLAILRMMIDPEEYAAWFTAPMHVLRMKGGRLGENIFASLFLPLKGKIKWHFQAEFEEEPLLKFLLQEWFEFERSAEGAMPWISLAPADFPAWVLTEPFVYRREFRPQPGKPVFNNQNGPVIRPCDQAQGRLQHLAWRTGEPVSALDQGEDGSPRLLVAMPGREVEEHVWTAGQSLALPLGVAEAATRHERSLLLLLALFAIFLAIGVAGRFLQPILAMAEAARRVMNRDFAVRLASDRDDEFGRLATAFNSMAEGVEQGRLLSRFVSESVQDAAKHADRESAARAGEQIETVVLFAGIERFKEAMKSQPPELLVRNLNLWLEAAAAAIRAQNGEVDKFIGEKVLAVFHPARFGSRQAAQQAAVAASREMAARLAALDPWKGHSIGVGIVIGPALAGILGSPDVRLEYTVIGDTVNLASRLCDLALKSGGGTVLERAGLDLLGGQNALLERVEALGDLTVKGKARSVECFRLPL